MKIKAFHFKLAFLLALLVAQAGYGQTFEKEKLVTKSFKLAPDTEVEVSNKYGDIHIVPWEKDSVRFEIKLKVITNKEAKLSQTFEYIDFDFKANNYYIIAKTVFLGKGTFWTDVSDVANNLFAAGTKTSIDYNIYLPEKTTLKVDNKYGNIYTTDLSGNLNIILSNGDLKAHHFSGKTILNSEFGNVTVQIIDNGTLSMSYGELSLEKAGNLTLTGKSSECRIEQINQLIIDSKRDKLYLTTVGTITGQTYFSNIIIDELFNKTDLNTKYGVLEIKEISYLGKSLLLKSNDTDIKLNFKSEMNYNIDMTVDAKTQVIYSAGITNIKTRELGGEDKLIKVQISIGKGVENSLPVKLDVRAGTVTLKLK